MSQPPTCRKLTNFDIEEILARMALWRANVPKRIARDLGISPGYVRSIERFHGRPQRKDKRSKAQRILDATAASRGTAGQGHIELEPR